MDNADLESLKLTPGRLSPKFSPAITEYTVLLSSAAAQVRVDCLTSDSGASYQIVGSGGERTVPLNEGLNTIKIEVSAPDGTVKTYTIKVTKLAANLAELARLTVTPGRLDRPYQKRYSEYYATLGWAVTEVKVNPVKQDPKMTVNIDGNPPDQPIALGDTETTVSINVTSPDGSTTKIYTIHLLKEDTGYRLEASDPKFRCGACCSLLSAPRRLRQCGHNFCTACLSVSQRSDKSCPSCNAQPPTKPPFDEVDAELRESLLSQPVDCFYCGTSVKNSELIAHAAACAEKLATCEKCYRDVKSSAMESDHAECVATCSQCNTKYPKVWEAFHTAMCLQGAGSAVDLAGHSVKVSEWEKKLRIESGDSFDELFAAGGKHEADYQKQRNMASVELGDLREKLRSAATAYANAISVNSRSAKAHHRLGVVLQELYYLDEMFGKGEEGKKEEASANKQAQESSKTEEIDAICEIHGVAASAGLGEKLRAIDAEYHALKDKGDVANADRVQGLYAWKSKQATQAEKTSFQASNEESYLGKAGKKFEDAVCLEPASFLFNYNLGLSYLAQMKYKEAAARLRVCVGSKPLQSHVVYLLGIALSKSKSDPDEALFYLTEGVRSYQFWVSCLKRDGMSNASEMFAETSYSYYQSQFLEGFFCLVDASKDTSLQTSLLLTVVYLVPRILLTIEHRGGIYLTIESILFSALDRLLAVVKPETAKSYAQLLSNLLLRSPDRGSQRLLEMQVDTCRKNVFVESGNGQVLTTLGNAIVSLYDITDKKTLLGEAETCFRVALEREGKPIVGGEVDDRIRGLKWYQERLAPKKEAAVPTKAAGAVRGGARGGAARGTAARGAARGAPRGGPAGRGAARGGAATRGGAIRGGANARGGPAGRGKPAPAARGKGHTCEPAKKSPEPSKSPEKPPSPSEAPVGPVNAKLAETRLGLAGVLKITGSDKEEIKSLLNEVIVMNPSLHDPYIELGELCRGTMEAVDVFDKFPFSEPLTFDDAYIYGEMVQILMKLAEFDDPRLEKALIGYGSVMGWNSLDTYVRKLENAYKTAVLKSVYCGVNGKNPEEADVQQFFKVKMW